MSDTDLYAEHYTEVAKNERVKAIKRTREYVLFCMAWVLLAAAIGVLIFVVREVSASEDRALCDLIDEAQWPETIKAPEFTGYPEKWEGVPAGTFDKEPLLLPVEDAWGSVYALYDLYDGSVLIIPIWDLSDDGPDSHNVCAALRWYPS